MIFAKIRLEPKFRGIENGKTGILNRDEVIEETTGRRSYVLLHKVCWTVPGWRASYCLMDIFINARAVGIFSMDLSVSKITRLDREMQCS